MRTDSTDSFTALRWSYYVQRQSR